MENVEVFEYTDECINKCIEAYFSILDRLSSLACKEEHLEPNLRAEYEEAFELFHQAYTCQFDYLGDSSDELTEDIAIENSDQEKLVGLYNRCLCQWRSYNQLIRYADTPVDADGRGLLEKVCEDIADCMADIDGHIEERGNGKIGLIYKYYPTLRNIELRTSQLRRLFSVLKREGFLPFDIPENDFLAYMGCDIGAVPTSKILWYKDIISLTHLVSKISMTAPRWKVVSRIFLRVYKNGTKKEITEDTLKNTYSRELGKPAKDNKQNDLISAILDEVKAN